MKSLIYSTETKKPCGISNGKYWIQEAHTSMVNPAVVKHHYSHKTAAGTLISFLVNDNKGFLQLGHGIRPQEKHTVSSLISPSNYLEFDRMWLDDILPKYSESQVISLLISYLKQVRKAIKFLITYADGTVDNFGTIYKATNAFRIGKSPSDIYLLQTGERVHPVTMWHRHKTRAWAFLQRTYPGIKRLNNNFQYRFLYVLDRKTKRAYLAEQRSKNMRLCDEAEELKASDFEDLLI